MKSQKGWLFSILRLNVTKILLIPTVKIEQTNWTDYKNWRNETKYNLV